MSQTQPSPVVPPHHWRSPLLGAPIEIDLPTGRLQCFVRGSGPTVVFAHGWLANGNLWRKVVDALADRFRCLTLDLPLGAHRMPCRADADLSATGVGALVAAALDALEATDATLVGNDSGGAYSQIAVLQTPRRVARLVLNSCETPYDAFPPPPFDGLPQAAASPARLGALLGALRDPAVRRSPAAYGWLIEHPIDDAAFDSYVLPCLEDAAVLRDTCKVMAGASTAAVHAAGRQLIASFRAPVLFAWGTEDRVFPIAHAERYAVALADGRVFRIEAAYSFTPEDQPARLAAAIAAFAG
jgi:pimeloyl-ACP methyl ester carboxylesterase